MAGIRSFRWEPVPHCLEELVGFRYAASHSHQVLGGPVRIIDATLTPPQPTLLHRGNKRLRLGDFA